MDGLLYAGNNLEKAQENFREGHQAPAAHQADDSAADAEPAATDPIGKPRPVRTALKLFPAGYTPVKR